MTQDNANQPTIAEEPQTSDQSHAMQVDTASEPITETQVAEPVTEEVEDEFAEAEEEETTEDASSDETAEAETASSNDSPDSTTTSGATPSTRCTPEADMDERSEIEKQPYDFDHSTVQIAIQLLPDDGDANGRMVVVGVRSHLDSPLLRLVRLNELGALPPLVVELLDALKAELPAREQAAREAFEKKKEEKAKRKETVTASRASRGKKTKATLSTAPASPSNSATDNRPRPEVQATTAPQQQMGLF